MACPENFEGGALWVERCSTSTWGGASGMESTDMFLVLHFQVRGFLGDARLFGGSPKSLFPLALSVGGKLRVSR